MQRPYKNKKSRKEQRAEKMLAAGGESAANEEGWAPAALLGTQLACGLPSATAEWRAAGEVAEREEPKMGTEEWQAKLHEDMSASASK